MTSPTVVTPYSTAFPLFNPSMKPTWVPDPVDVERLQSYELYDRIYWTVPDTYKLVARGFEDKPIYIPTARTIVEATHRYTTPAFSWRVTPRTGTQAGASTDAAVLFFNDLFAREEFLTRYLGNKRFGLIKGDWLWHITADPVKPEGSRISITAIDPASYFPITDENDVSKIVGCHLVEMFTRGTDVLIKRLTYRKVVSTSGVSITVEEGLFKLDKWGGPEDRPVQVLRSVTALPPEITALPVYHIKNFEEPQNPFGSSELRGFERIMAAVNQGISDEELTLALDGLGLYATDAPPPRDDDNNPLPTWPLGPGRVVEIPTGRKFDRVTGVGTVTPYQDHLNWMVSHLRQASGTPDIAVGIVDVSVAQSGIALALQLGPLLAKTDEKDQIILDKHTQMFYDLVNGWVPAFEGATFTDQQLKPIAGDKIPIDRTARLAELNDMLDRGVIDGQYYRDEAQKLGYVFPADMATRVAEDQASRAAAADPFGGRANADLGTQ